MKKTLRTAFGMAVTVIALAGCDGGPDPAVPSAAGSMQATESGSDLIYESLALRIRDPDDFARASGLAALLPTLGPEALPAVKRILDHAAALEMGLAEFALLMHDWASHEPADAAAYAIESTPRAYQVAAIHAAVAPWARANPQEARESVRASTLKGHYRAAAQIALVRGWYDSGEPGLEEHVHALSAGFEREHTLAGYAIAVIRKRGADALVRWAEAVPEGDATYTLEVYPAVAAALVPFDPEAAQRFCDAHCEAEYGSALRTRIAGLEAPDGAPAATQSAASGPDLSYQSLVELIGDRDDFAKASRLGALLPKLGPGALPAVKKVLGDAEALDMGGVEYELLLRYWAAHEPAEAGFYALATSPFGYRVAAIYAAVPPWVTANPQQTLKTVQVFSIQGGDPAAAAQVVLVRGWYASGQPGLEEYIRDLGAGFERQRALAAYSMAMLRKRGAEALVQWAEAVPEDEADYKLEVFRAAGPALAAFDVPAAKRFCDAHCDGPHGSNLRNRIATRWAREGAPIGPLEWLESGPEGQERNLAVRLTYAVWGRMDPDAAIRWMNEKTAGEPPAWVRPAWPIYARLLAVDSPAEGLAWAARLDTEKERDVVTLEIAHAWRKKDEAAAEAWLRQSSLPPEMIEFVRASREPLIRGKRPYRYSGS